MPDTDRMLTVPVEPLTIPDEERAESLIDLFRRSVDRNPDNEALRWRQAEAGQSAEAEAWTSRT